MASLYTWLRKGFPSAVFSGYNLAGQFWCHSQSTVKISLEKSLQIVLVSTQCVLYQGGLSGDSVIRCSLPVSVGLQEESCYRSSLLWQAPRFQQQIKRQAGEYQIPLRKEKKVNIADLHHSSISEKSKDLQMLCNRRNNPSRQSVFLKLLVDYRWTSQGLRLYGEVRIRFLLSGIEVSDENYIISMRKPEKNDLLFSI